MCTQHGTCIICYESHHPPMQSGCGCRGDNGLAHYQCLANKAAYQPHRGDASWRSCQTCLRLRGLLKRTDVKPETGRTDVEQVLGWTTTAPDDPNALVFKGHLALALSNASRFRESNRLFKVVLGQMATVYGTRHPSTMQIEQHYALSLLQQGLFSEAERANRTLLVVLTATYGETNSSTMACIDNLATCLTKQGKYTEAEPMLRRLLAHKKRIFGHEHPSTCKTSFQCPCGKQHWRGLPRPDWVGSLTNKTYSIVCLKLR